MDAGDDADAYELAYREAVRALLSRTRRWTAAAPAPASWYRAPPSRPPSWADKRCAAPFASWSWFAVVCFAEDSYAADDRLLRG